MSTESITVAQAIARLQSMPPDAVLAFIDNDGDEVEVTELTLVPEETGPDTVLMMSLVMGDYGPRPVRAPPMDMRTFQREVLDASDEAVKAWWDGLVKDGKAFGKPTVGVARYLKNSASREDRR